jgi:hypothetical protein
MDSLKDFTGIWAHSRADCKKMSGQLDREGVDLGDILIIRAGRNLRRRGRHAVPARQLRRFRHREAEGPGRVQRGVPDQRLSPDKWERVLLKVQGSDTILFADQKFMIFGKYVRCSHTYTCEKSWNK